MKIMKKYMLFLLSGVLAASCIDTTVLPDGSTVGEDYWKNKDEVTAMVAGAYNAMTAGDFIQRCIVWGDFRSDELDILRDQSISSGNETALSELKEGFMTYTNVYANWTTFYDVINKCNIVLERAPGVVDIDPSYTVGTLRTDESQMLALRSLCYFYLVRAFRDVPVTDGAYMNSSQNFDIPQQPPLTVLGKCITDLEKALETPLSPQGYTDWRKVGLINKDVICSILADVYLWRGSMTHNIADYQKCVEYCDRVLESKKEMYPKDDFNAMKDYENLLYTGDELYANVFVRGNSDESIFELQMDGRNGSNLGLSICYCNYDGTKLVGTGLMKATASLFNGTGSDKVFTHTRDYRLYESCYDSPNEQNAATGLDVFKMVSPMSAENSASMTDLKNVTTSVNLGYTNIGRNWIFYRLSDVMLMKAEALVQLGASDPANLTAAFALVDEVNRRSLAVESPAATDVLDQGKYQTVDAMEELVLQERLRELCFEGKRWFDLMRYNYRHMDGVQPDKILADIGSDPKAMAPNYTEMLTIMTRGLDNGAAVRAKMLTEPYLYFPVLNSEIKVNYALKQNPAYVQDDDYVKN